MDYLIFTHHHFDHNVDYPCFLLTRWDETTAQNDLQVFGPTLTEQLTHRLMDRHEGAFAPDWVARINHVAKMAQEAGARRLVLTHQHPKLDRPGQTERAIRDITRHYDGEVIWGRDMMVFEP